jgi:hypothetical protein
MEQENTFRTKSGFCQILSDRIILTRDGAVGKFSEFFVGDKISRILVIYSVIVLFLFFFAFKAFQENKIATFLFNSSFAIYLLFKIKQSLNFSATPIIERNKIKEVKFYDAKFGATRSRFEVIFEDEDGNLKTRLILLPGSLDNGESETKKALQIMKAEKLL